MGRKLEIAVCGCGPAGLTAALLLHRSGHRVRIFERFDMPRPVGSGLILQPTGLAVLERLGLLDRICAVGARIQKLFGRVVPSGRIVLDVRYRALGHGWQAIAVHRAALFDALHESVCSARIDIVPSVTIQRLQRQGARATIIGAHDRPIGTFDLVVDALGANSPLAAGVIRRKTLAYGALWVNVPWATCSSFSGNALEQRYRRASHMAGVLPIGRRAANQPQQAAFFWSLKRGEVAEWRARDLGEWKSQVQTLWPETASLLATITSHDELTFAQYDHFTAAKPYSAALVHVGDSGRATSPQLGQGANMALLDALALTRALEMKTDCHEALELYARMRRWHVRLFQWASAIFTPFYQSDSRLLPFVRDWLAAPLSRLPVGDIVLARLVSGMTLPALRGTSFSPLPLEELDREKANG